MYSDKLYELNSADNVKEYDYIYSSYKSVNQDYDIHAPKYGIIVKDEEIILKSALLIAGGGGATAPHKTSALIDNDSLIVILGDSIFSISLPYLSTNWVTVREDCVTWFEIFNYIDGYNGELSILKIDKLGKVEWEFFGRDIFTTIDSVDDFKVYDNYIIAKPLRNVFNQ